MMLVLDGKPKIAESLIEQYFNEKLLGKSGSKILEINALQYLNKLATTYRAPDVPLLFS